MPPDEKVRSQAVAHSSELDEKFIASYWKFVEVCLTRIFHQSDADAKQAISRMRQNLGEATSEKAAWKSPDRSLAVFHDSPLQTAAILAGVSRRPLTQEELVAYAELQNDDLDETARPTPEQIRQAYILESKVR
jgi:hypothetical protein